MTGKPGVRSDVRVSSACRVGVDGGGTRSRALVGDGAGRELGASDGGPGLIDPRDPERAVRVVAAVVRVAVADAGVDLPVRGVWVGLAGAGNEAARRAVEVGLRDAGLARAVAVGSDVEAAHADAFGDGPGVLLVVGTGSAVRAVDPRGEVVRVGGGGRSWATREAATGSGWAGCGLWCAARTGGSRGRRSPMRSSH